MGAEDFSRPFGSRTGSLEASRDPLIGRTINNYEIKALIGEGGMGMVYVAEHPVIGRKAAVKILIKAFVDDQMMVTRFINEARAANAIRHPNIIDIIDVGQLPDGQPYLMMEFLDGETLSDRLRRMVRVPLTQALSIADQAANALATAHEAGIIHRDLKPENLFIITDSEAPFGERVKVLDFGIAKLRSTAAERVTRTTGTILGTPLYMSPEQCRGVSAEVDSRTDVYALGGLLYHMLCGVPPFVAQSAMDLMLLHMRQAPQPPRSINPEIPEHVEAVILQALAKESGQRFASMAILRQALAGTPGLTVDFRTGKRLQSEPSLTALNSDSQSQTVSHWRRRRLGAWIAGGAAVLLTAAVAVWALSGDRRAAVSPAGSPSLPAPSAVPAPSMRAAPAPAPAPASEAASRPPLAAPEVNAPAHAPAAGKAAVPMQTEAQGKAKASSAPRKAPEKRSDRAMKQPRDTPQIMTDDADTFGRRH
jgi:serine/threonine-protein kinase